MTSKSKGPRQLQLGTAVTDDDKVITGSRLPTSRQVLLCLLAEAIISLFDEMKGMLKRKNVKKTEAFTEKLN